MNLTPRLTILSKFLFRILMRVKNALPKRQSSAFSVISTNKKPKIQHIYVINLDHQHERLNRIRKELNQVLDSSGKELWSLTERYKAVDAAQFLNDPIIDGFVEPNYSLRDQLFVEPQPLTFPTKIELDAPISMSRPEIAIALSHIGIWKKVKESKYDYVLILEDDIWLPPIFAKKLDQVWSEIIIQTNKQSNFDILYLSFEEVKHGAPKTSISNNLFCPVRGLWFLSGYILSREGATKLLELLPCIGPVDLWINHQFKSLDVLAIKYPIIFQRRDFGSTNSYSILPTLTKIGAINSESAALFHIRPNESPVFVFGTKNSGLTSLAMALSMLGYRCCSDLDMLPDKELEMLLNKDSNRIFDAYVNVGGLLNEISVLYEKYPDAKYILTKRELETLNSSELSLMAELNVHNLVILNLETKNKWKVICEHLRCSPPVCSFPEQADVGQRTLLQKKDNECQSLRFKILKRDKSPWVIEQIYNWNGIKLSSDENLSSSSMEFVNFRDSMEFLDTKRWFMREDTFTGNKALFRSSNINFKIDYGAVLTVKKEHLGVRDFSAAALTSYNQYLYGKFEAEIKVSNISGVVSGMFLHRDSPRQEIDIEIAGNRTDQLLINVYYNPGSSGSKFDYGYRGSPVIIDLGFDASEDFHVYTIEWKSNEINWFVDNRIVHKRFDWDPTPIPHLPMAFHTNIWPTHSKELAGRLEVQKLPSNTFIKSIAIEANQKH